MPAKDVMELALVIRERMIEGHDRASRNPENEVHALPDEGLTHDLGSGTFFRHRILHASR
jgi:hypothetical protein